MEAYAENKGSFAEGVKLPLAMFAVELNSKKRLLFDVSSRKIHGVSSPVFPDATCAFENGGWLLMIQHKSLNFQEQTVFLVNLKSRRWLHLPVVNSCDKGFFIFHVNSHGVPLVVARIEIWSLVPTVHIACPGDVYWSVYTHDVDLRGRCRLVEPTCIIDVALLGTQAICLDLNGEILIFNIIEMTWKRSTAYQPMGTRKDDRFLVAGNGEVVLVSRQTTFRFYKLNMEALEWSPLDDWELDDTSWFLCKGQSFRVREVGKRKVYTFGGPKHCTSSVESCTETSNSMEVTTTTCFSSTFGHEIFKSITNVYAYNLDNETVEMVIPASVVTEVRYWVQPNIFATPAK